MGVSNSRKVLITILVACAVVFSLNFISSQLLEYFTPNKGYQLIRKKWDILEKMESPADILVLGDSSGNQGVDTDLITELTGKSAVNLATIGNALALNNYWMLETYIKKFGKPECVINIHVYDTWYRNLNESVVSQIPMDTSDMLQQLTQIQLGIKPKFGYLLAKYIPSLGQNTSLKKLLMRPWAMAYMNQGIPLTVTGFYSSPKAKPKMVLKDTDNHKKFVSNNIFIPSKENTYALKKMGELSETLDFNLIFANSPVFEGLFSDENYKTYLSAVNEYIGRVTKKYKNIQLLYATQKTYRSSDMENADHLTSMAAKEYTLQLLENANCHLYSEK
jgi:hypothetical protein